METRLLDISKILLRHYVPAWLAWSAVFCFVFSSLPLSSDIIFFSLFAEVQAQTLSIYLMISIPLFYLRTSGNTVRLVSAFFTMIAGILAWEFMIGMIHTGKWETALQDAFHPDFIILRFFCGSFLVWCFMLAEKYCLSEQLLSKQKISRLVEEKKLTQSEIRYLKSRIDPELLFSELKTILLLRETDPDKAKAAQLNLVRRLRESLSNTKNIELT